MTTPTFIAPNVSDSVMLKEWIAVVEWDKRVGGTALAIVYCMIRGKRGNSCDVTVYLNPTANKVGVNNEEVRWLLKRLISYGYLRPVEPHVYAYTLPAAGDNASTASSVSLGVS